MWNVVRFVCRIPFVFCAVAAFPVMLVIAVAVGPTWRDTRDSLADMYGAMLWGD
jgi:hypothetical protein